MKDRIILILLIISLAMNAGIIGTMLYRRSQPDRNFRVCMPEDFRPMNLNEEQKMQLHLLADEFRTDNDSIFYEIHMKRVHLTELLRQDRVDSQSVCELIDEIALLQAQSEKQMILNIHEVKKILTPEQFEIMMQTLGRRVGPPREDMNKNFKGGIK